MTKEQIKLLDFRRILLGDVPAEFYLELIIRAFLFTCCLWLPCGLLVSVCHLAWAVPN
jgi:hypothetical protein